MCTWHVHHGVADVDNMMSLMLLIAHKVVVFLLTCELSARGKV
jgi:hypothetical protein